MFEDRPLCQQQGHRAFLCGTQGFSLGNGFIQPGPVAYLPMSCDFGNELSELLVFVMLHFRRAVWLCPFFPEIL